MNGVPELDAGFWNRLAPKYAKKPVPDEKAYQLTLQRVKAHLSKNDHVLEVGCGTGSTALALAPYVLDTLATDLSSEMIAIARRKAEANDVTNVHFATGLLGDATLEPESFDVVMAFNLIHLLADIPASLRRIHELVKPGGLFISKTPCIGEDSIFVRALIPILRAVGQAPFVNCVKKTALEAAVVDAGFEVLETGLYPAKSHSLFIVAKK